MSEPVWLSKVLILAVHARLLAEHGGMTGLRDEALLESPLAAPRNRHLYEHADLFTLAATYAAGIARNHPFADGNKRTALVAAGVFLELNGWRLATREPDAVNATVALASGDLAPDEFAAWLRLSSVRKES